MSRFLLSSALLLAACTSETGVDEDTDTDTDTADPTACGVDWDAAGWSEWSHQGRGAGLRPGLR